MVGHDHGPRIMKSNGKEVTIELMIGIGSTMLQTEEAICAGLNEAGVAATEATLVCFDRNGKPIIIDGEKWTEKASEAKY